MVDGMDIRQINQTVLNALLAYEAQKNNKPVEDKTLLQDLESAAVDVTNTLQALIDELAKYQRLWLANGVSQLIEATADGAVVAGGAFEKARWLELWATFDAFQAWLTTPVTHNGVTIMPVMVISKRYVPPKQE